ncbi:sigma 54-interacting transcriptional regulator [Dyella lutea]
MAMQLEVVAAQRCVIWLGRPTGEEVRALASEGWSIRVVDAVDVGRLQQREGDPMVALADLRGCDVQMQSAIARQLEESSNLTWLALLGTGTKTGSPAVQRILRDSAEYFTVPLDVARLARVLSSIAQGVPAPEGDDFPDIVGQSDIVRSMCSYLRKFAPVDLPVLITGETGTGKEGAAQALHRFSRRRDRPFVPINCGALPVHLVQSELFGHERGAFTGATARRIGHIESAAGGTVFLDEIGDLPLDAQTSLLRFLQEGTIERLGSSQPIRADARVVAATHVDLERAVEAGRFREDLFYRLNVLRLAVPPLRERGGDVELIAQHVLDRFREHHPCRARTFGVAARAAMRRYAWPGNVRELINRVQRAAVVAEDAVIGAADLDLSTAVGQGDGVASLDATRVRAEREAILACLRESRFNISECARRLSISRVTVYRLCKKHHLALDELR